MSLNFDMGNPLLPQGKPKPSQKLSPNLLPSASLSSSLQAVLQSQVSGIVWNEIYDSLNPEVKRMKRARELGLYDYASQAQITEAEHQQYLIQFARKVGLPEDTPIEKVEHLYSEVERQEFARKYNLNAETATWSNIREAIDKRQDQLKALNLQKDFSNQDEIIKSLHLLGLSEDARSTDISEKLKTRDSKKD